MSIFVPNKTIPLYIGTTYANLNDGTALVFSYADMAPRIVEGVRISVDAEIHHSDAVERNVAEQIRISMTAGYKSLLVADRVIYLPMNRYGVIYKTLRKSSAVLYFVKFSDQMCNEIVDWNGKLRIFSNPIDHIATTEKHIKFVSNPGMEASISAAVNQFKINPQEFLRTNPYNVSFIKI